MLKMNYALAPLFLVLLACGDKESKTDAPTTQTESKAPAKDEANIGEVLATINGIAIGSNDYQKIASRTSPSDGKGLNAEEKKHCPQQHDRRRVTISRSIQSWSLQRPQSA